LQLSETYGNVFTFHMGPKKYVVLTGYEAVKEALVTQADDFSGRGQMHTTDHFSKGGNGIIFGKGESWRVMRRFTLSILRDFGMGKKTIEDRIIEESQKLVEVFQSHKGNDQTNSRDNKGLTLNGHRTQTSLKFCSCVFPPKLVKDLTNLFLVCATDSALLFLL
ncbi:CP2G1 protein, partial [Polyodon spathula]|nr:CP2G1 protein [Polyodon spathula]